MAAQIYHGAPTDIQCRQRKENVAIHLQYLLRAVVYGTTPFKTKKTKKISGRPLFQNANAANIHQQEPHSLDGQMLLHPEPHKLFRLLRLKGQVDGLRSRVAAKQATTTPHHVLSQMRLTCNTTGETGRAGNQPETNGVHSQKNCRTVRKWQDQSLALASLDSKKRGFVRAAYVVTLG